MANDLTIALEITLVGMALVFAMILLLWLVMLILMRLTADHTEREVLTNSEERDLKRRAAALAVAAALAREQDKDQPHPFPLPPTAIVTAWQAVQRGRLLSEKGPKR
jgi:Na+-transporting methylmalonyl-CoA/oxaloacetate decarboxylase gamma subunit